MLYNDATMVADITSIEHDNSMASVREPTQKNACE